MKAVEGSISGLKCDAPDCDYRDDDIRVEEYESYLGKPCPKCGANLLTEADLAAVKAIMSAVDWLNKVVPPGPDDSPVARIKVSFDGSGIPEVSEPTVDEKGHDHG